MTDETEKRLNLLRPPGVDDATLMTAQQLSAENRADGRMGWCPYCYDNDGYVNVGADHWFVCDTHRTCWRAGTNLFSGWHEESEFTQRRSRGLLAGYTVVEPVFPPSVRPDWRMIEVLGADEANRIACAELVGDLLIMFDEGRREELLAIINRGLGTDGWKLIRDPDWQPPPPLEFPFWGEDGDA